MSKKFKRSLLSIFSLAMVCIVALGFVGCKKTDDTTPSQQASPAIVWTIDKAYAQAQSEGFEGTIEEFLAHLSNISDIKLDDLGRLIFTLGDGTQITAGTVTAGAPGRGVESVEVVPDRWGLVVTNVFTYTDGSTTTTTYSAGVMYGREYDFVSATELGYLIDNGVEYVVLRNDIDMGSVDYAKELGGNLYVNLNQYTFKANTISFESEGNVEVAIRNGVLQTTEGVNFDVPNGRLRFENVMACDKDGLIELNASTSSIYFSGMVGFGEGEMNGLSYPVPATVKIPADTRIVVEDAAELYVEKIEVVEVQDYEKPIVVIVNSSETEDINVVGDVLVYGNTSKVIATGATTYATVVVDEFVYANLNDAMEKFHEGAVVELIGNTTWNLTEDAVIGYQITIRTGSYKITGDFLSHIKTADEYYSQITYKVDSDDGVTQIVDTITILKCTDHTYVKGYCSTCDHEDLTAEFVVRVDERKYLTFEEVFGLLEDAEEIVLLNDVDWVSETERTIDFTFTISNPLSFEFGGTGLDNLSFAENYYLSVTPTEIKVLYCEEHVYVLGFCRNCGKEDTTPNKYVATINGNKYESLQQIITAGHLNGATVELIADAAFTSELEVDFEFTINCNNFDIEGLENLVLLDTYYRDEIVEETTVGGAVVVKHCPAHNYNKYGYCQNCDYEDAYGNFVAQIGDRKYLELAHMIEQNHFVNGVTIDLLKNTEWNLDSNMTINFTFTLNMNGKTLEGNALSKLVVDTENGYYWAQSGDGVYKVEKCTDHGEYKNDKGVYSGYCKVCGKEDPSATFAIQSGDRKFVSFDSMVEQEFFFEDDIVITLLKNVEWNLTENLVVENKFRIVLGEHTITGTAFGDLTTLADDKVVCADTYYRADVQGETIEVRRDTAHTTYEYGYCKLCGHKQEGVTFVAKIGDRYYLSFADILAQGHFTNGVVVVMLEDATWDLENELTVSFNMTVNAEGHTLSGTALEKIKAGTGYIKEQVGNTFRIYECTEHTNQDGVCTKCNKPETPVGGDEA